MRVIVCLVLLLAWGSSVAAAGEFLQETLHRFPANCRLDSSAGPVEFTPQSLARDGKELVLVNRGQPALVRLPLDGSTPPRLQTLQQTDDAKFSARFFTDYAASGSRRFVFEQSTATLRELGAEGKLGKIFAPSGREDQSIERCFSLDNGRFLFLDRGTRRALLRDLETMALGKDLDPPSGTWAWNGEDALVSPAGFLTLERNGETLEALLTPLEETEEISLLAAWSTSRVRGLDTTADGAFWLYVAEGQTAHLERFDASARPVRRETFSCPCLHFPPDATRIACAVEDGSFCLLTRDGEDAVIIRLRPADMRSDPSE